MLEEEEKEKENELEKKKCKLVFIGDSGVGKTSIIYRFIRGTFENNVDSTNGATFANKKIEYKEKNIILQFDIWDTAGQEKFHSLGKHFYKDSYIVCLVYDITNQESLDALQTIWYPDLLKYGEKNVVLAVVGNKCHLYENDILANEEQAKKFAKDINAIFMLTSAKTGDGIDKLFDTLVDKFLSLDFKLKYKEMLEKKAGNIALKKENNNNSNNNNINRGRKKKKCF